MSIEAVSNVYFAFETTDFLFLHRICHILLAEYCIIFLEEAMIKFDRLVPTHPPPKVVDE